MQVRVIADGKQTVIKCTGVILEFDNGVGFAVAAEYPDRKINYADCSQPEFNGLLSYLQAGESPTKIVQFNDVLDNKSIIVPTSDKLSHIKPMEV